MEAESSWACSTGIAVEHEPLCCERGDMVSEQAAGLRAKVEEASSTLAAVLAALDCDRTPGRDATVLYGAFCRAERLVSAAKAVLSARVEWSGVWQLFEHTDAASLLAEVEGVSPGTAKRTLSLGRRLPFLPGTEAALRRGELSPQKAEQLTRTAVLDPSLEAELLAGATEEPFFVVSERCRAIRDEARGTAPAAALFDEETKPRFSSWTDASGAFCYEGRDTTERGEAFLAHLGETAKMLRAARREAGVVTGDGAVLKADALFALVTGETRPSLRGVAGEAVYSEGSSPRPGAGPAPALAEPWAAPGDTGPWAAGPGADPWTDDALFPPATWPSDEACYTKRE